VSRAEELKANLEDVRAKIEKAADKAGRVPSDINLVVVTKTFPTSDAQILYDLGVRAMGENRDDEGASKSEQLPSDVEWHFQGQIQSRKMKSISGWADVVHSIDSLSHANKFDAALEGKTSRFFVQVNLEPERQDRGGVGIADLEPFLSEIYGSTQIRPVGLMTVAPIEVDPLAAFHLVKEAQEKLLVSFPSLVHLSMGMSGDFETAISAGATHIRVGSSILGSRGYPA